MTELSYGFLHTRARPSKALAVLPMFQEFRLDDIEITYNGTVNGYVIPMQIERFLEVVAERNHHIQKLHDSFYILTCFKREVFKVIPSDDKVVVLL